MDRISIVDLSDIETGSIVGIKLLSAEQKYYAFCYQINEDEYG